MTDITKLSLLEAKAALLKKEFSAKELTQSYITNIKQNEGRINSFITQDLEAALEKAVKADEQIAQGEVGLLTGLPIGIKDNFCTKGVLTTCASHILHNFTPTYESTVTSNLWRNGAVMIGKLNMDEFAMGSASSNSYYGQVNNPLKRNNDEKILVPGGSSGGSAAAVAANFCAASIGSDTGGSVRQPASFTGLVGFKPSFGRCSRWGMIAYASSLDQAGPMTKTVGDSALMFSAMAGFDPKDSTSANVAVPDFNQLAKQDIKGLKVGIPKEYQIDGMDSQIKKLWEEGAEMLKKAGAEIVEISLPMTKYADPTYYIVATAEASSNLARFDGVRYGLRICDEGDSLDDMYEKTRAAGFGKEVKKRIMVGTYVLSAGYYDAYYTKALQTRRLIKEDFDKAFEQVDVILTPTTPNDAFSKDEKLSTIEMYLNDVFTVAANLAGVPAISIPAGLSARGMPLSLQLLAKPFAEETLFKAALNLEEALNFKQHKLNYIF
jgi:aspartyl-tRNA(Asn)/glutamyl-tRNA(Gln) amidotransferase subunit A